MIEWDLSLSTGYSINERESSVALLDEFPDRVRVVSQRPDFPHVFHDSRIRYVPSHRRHHPLHYPRFVHSLWGTIRKLIVEDDPAAIIFRPGPLPIIPAMTIRGGHGVILKKLGGYRRFEERRRPFRMRAVGTVAKPLFSYITRHSLGADVESHAYMRWIPSTFGVSPTKLCYIPNAANTQFFAPSDRRESRRRHGWERFQHLVGYVGAIDQLRCIDRAVDAACALGDVPGLGFVFVGKGPEVERLRTRVQERGLSDRILFPGFVPYDEVPSVINAFDVALDLTKVPFLIGDVTVHGSYSQKIAQYLACGVPVVAWRTDDTAFLDSNDLGATVEPERTESLVQALRARVRRGALEPGDRLRLRQYAEEELSARAIARRRVAFWERLVSRQRARNGNKEE